MITEGSVAPTLGVSVVTYHSDLARLGATLRCLARALDAALATSALGDYFVVVLDNASGADYRAQLAVVLRDVGPAFTRAPQLQLGLENLGYGIGNNRALAGRESDLVLVLNPDIELANDALQVALGTLADEPQLVAVAPACRRPDGEREYLCKRYPSVLDLLLRGCGIPWLTRRFDARLARYEYRDRDPERAGDVILLSGACMLMRRAAFDAVGGFSPAFFMYFEDYDLSLRLARLGGLRYEPGMRVEHHGGGAARKGWHHIRWFVSSALRFFHGHGWRWL